MHHDRLLPAVEAIYDAAASPLQWPRALSEIAVCFDDAGAVLQWRKDDKAFGAIASENLRDALHEYQVEWAEHDFKDMLVEQSGYFFNGEQFGDRHLATIDEKYLHHPFNARFLAKHGLGWFGAVAVSPEPATGVLLSVQRTFSKDQFSGCELEAIGVLGRHVEKSLRLSMRLLDTELLNLGLGDALARIGMGVFALDQSARVVFANPPGQGLIGSVFDIVGGRLCVCGGAAPGPFDDALARALDAEGPTLLATPKPVLVDAAATGRRFAVYLLPVAAVANAADHFLTHTRAFALVIEQKVEEPPDPAVVRDVLGLTLGEARIAALVGSGLPPKEAALRLGISENTARHVLKQIFRKAGISRQSELSSLLAKLALR